MLSAALCQVPTLDIEWLSLTEYYTWFDVLLFDFFGLGISIPQLVSRRGMTLSARPSIVSTKGV